MGEMADIVSAEYADGFRFMKTQISENWALCRKHTPCFTAVTMIGVGGTAAVGVLTLPPILGMMFRSQIETNSD
jgi:hypothetical protein